MNPSIKEPRRGIEEHVCSLPMEMDGQRAIAIGVTVKKGRTYQVCILLKALIYIEVGPNNRKPYLIYQIGWEVKTDRHLTHDQAAEFAIQSTLIAYSKYQQS